MTSGAPSPLWIRACVSPGTPALPRVHGPRCAAGLRLARPRSPLRPTTPDEQKSLETFQDRVIDPLFVLNAERAKEERRLGLGSKKPRQAKPSKQRPASAAKQEGLSFDD